MWMRRRRNSIDCSGTLHPKRINSMYVPCYSSKETLLKNIFESEKDEKEIYVFSTIMKNGTYNVVVPLGTNMWHRELNLLTRPITKQIKMSASRKYEGLMIQLLRL
ncbi:hypothetical protein EDC96DRAFT_550102 [Choanephora cucurbitarum]|nr:hypothetical protein EDC96DRAFT_550102 [Choanephora cucurbitarum]